MSEFETNDDNAVSDAATGLAVLERGAERDSERGPVNSTDINRSELQRWLADYTVEIRQATLDLLTEEQAESLWDWMELHPDESLAVGDELDLAWCGKIPEFMEFREGGKVGEKFVELRLIALKSEPEILDAETVDEPAGEEIKAEVTNKTADVNLLAENRRQSTFIKLIRDASSEVSARTFERDAAKSAVESAKAELKEAQAELDKATASMIRVVQDEKTGQQQLPFDDMTIVTTATPATVKIDGAASDSSTETASATIDAKTQTPWPITELSQSQIKKTVGKDVFNQAKAVDDPIGLSAKQLEKLEAAEWSTVELLEKAMREVRDWWVALAAKQDAAIVTRVISTLNAFRKVNPAATE